MILTIRSRGSVPSPDFSRPLKQAAQRSLKLAFTDARRNVAPHTKTGETMRRLRPVSLGTRGFELRDAAPQAWFLEYGTRPHKIRPKRAKALRFIGRSGQPVFAKEVNHPGTKADPFMGPAVFGNGPRFERIYAGEIEKELDR